VIDKVTVSITTMSLAVVVTPAAAGAQRCDVQGGRRGRFSTGHAALTTTTGSWL